MFLCGVWVQAPTRGVCVKVALAMDKASVREGGSLNLALISVAQAMSPPDSRRAVGFRLLGGVARKGGAPVPTLRLPATLFGLEAGDRLLLLGFIK